MSRNSSATIGGPGERGGHRALLIGGTDFFGSLVVDDLVAHTNLATTTSSRDATDSKTTPWERRISRLTADLRDEARPREAAQRSPTHNPCARALRAPPPAGSARGRGGTRVHYPDISESRLFRQALIEPAEETDRAGDTRHDGLIQPRSAAGRPVGAIRKAPAQTHDPIFRTPQPVPAPRLDAHGTR